MHHVLRRALALPAVAGLLLGAGVAVTSFTSQAGAQVTPCTATASATTATPTTPVTINVSGLTPNGDVTTQLASGAGSSASTRIASATGTLTFTQTYPTLSHWTALFTDTSTGTSCSVSWTVVPEPTTTTTPTAPVAPVAPPAPAPVAAAAKFTG